MNQKGCTMKDGATQPGPRVVVEVIAHDWIAKIPLRGAGRRHLWKKYVEIYRQR